MDRQVTRQYDNVHQKQLTKPLNEFSSLGFSS